MTRDELTRRRSSYDRFRWIAGAIGAAPLLSVYFLVHTTYLRAFLPESKELSALVLIGVPLGWMFGVGRLARGWGARQFGLQCPACGNALVDDGLRRGDDRDACRRCGAEFADVQEDRPAA